MKNSQNASVSGQAIAPHPLSRSCLAAVLAGLLSVSLPVVLSRAAQPAGNEADGAEVLTRGPVHEAFAGVVSFNPEPGIVVHTPPPALIEEIPPAERPEGDDVAWIPGYWGWDDERNDYLWISGTWRVLPPGREWMAGYWRDTGQGYQWISGYWSDATQQETTYLPPPPASLEVGANIAAPSDDYGWTPGCWVWVEGRYAWRAGYWAEGRADWVWAPSYYVWTPRGDIYVEGFWDYPVEHRGILFAPVYYRSRGYARPGYSYSPRIAISLAFFSDNLFLRPSYSHYYFGDYYDSRYEQDGFYMSYAWQSGRHGYDPFYSHDRWEHRADRDWDSRYRSSYQYRRENVAARPPRTWSAQLTFSTRTAAGGQVSVSLAAPIEQLAARKDNPVRFQPVAQGDRQKLAQRGREVQQSRDQRRTVEAGKAAVTPGRNANEAVAPARVPAPRSPIAARPDARRGKTPAPPPAPPAPRPDSKVQPKTDVPGRQPDADRRNPPAVARPAEPDKPGQPGRNTPAARETKAAPAADPRQNAAAAKAQEESQQKEQQAQARAQQDERRAQEANAKSQAAEKSQQAAAERAQAAAAVKSRDEAQRKDEQAQARAQQDERRAQDAKAKSQAAEMSQQAAAERAGAANAAKARDESQRQDEQARAKAQQDDGRRAKEANAPAQAADKSPPPAAERANAPAAKTRDESPRRESPAQVKAPPEAPRGSNEAAKAKPAPKGKPAQDEADDAKK